MLSAIRIFLVFCLLCLSTYARGSEVGWEFFDIIDQLEQLNRQLMDMNDESAFNEIFVQKTTQLEQLIVLVKNRPLQQLQARVDRERLFFLSSRIKINQQRGNAIAVMRDQAELALGNTRLEIASYLEFLGSAATSYLTVDRVLAESNERLADSRQLAATIKVDDETQGGRIFADLKDNYRDFLPVNATYQDLLQYVIKNPEQIVSQHWSQKISLLSVIGYINHFEMIRPINRFLIPFAVDVGGLTVSIFIMLFAYFSLPLLFRFTSWFIPQYLIDANNESHKQIYLEIRKPARALLIFFGIDLATYAFFYKTDFRSSIEVITFVVYSLIIVWLLFKFLDTVVLLRVRELSKVNKELRKELFDLGVQAGKGLIFIIVLAFGLSHFGISVTAIMSTLGIGGLAFALAAKDSLSNLFGGITILFDNLYRMGDWVSVGDVEGTVAEIGLRSTTIRTFDNALITIPNAQVSVSSVKNWNRRVVGRRIKMHIGVTYESNMNNIRQAISDIREMLKAHPGIANPKEKNGINYGQYFKLSSLEDVRGVKATQLVFMDRYSDFSIDILIYCFSKTVNWADWLAVKEDVLFKIAEILQQNHLEFAYPTQVRINRQATFPELDVGNDI